MRFLPDGGDIPEQLLRDVNDGQAVFVCGAGVSRHRAGLPLFGTLTEQVYADLGESFDHEPAEQRAIEREEYDRALTCLEKRTRRPGDVSRVRAAVANCLKPPAGPLPDHEALLQLSQDPDGCPRLLTTNFDTLFERAAQYLKMTVPSHAGKALPDPGRTRDHGILHLHGRLADADLSLEMTDLILTSADFGEAYLRDGWAARYIEHRMRLGPLVLVGYHAEDAAMRLLLEALDADRARFPDLHEIYALSVHTASAASDWKSKGILPIEFQDFGLLYQTLSEWAQYRVDPRRYRQRRLQDILLGPSGIV